MVLDLLMHMHVHILHMRGYFLLLLVHGHRANACWKIHVHVYKLLFDTAGVQSERCMNTEEEANTPNALSIASTSQLIIIPH